MPDYGTLRDQAVTDLPGRRKAFAGQADDPFFLDLRVFDLLYGGDLTEVGQDTLAGYNVNTHRAAGAVQGRARSRATPSATRSSASGAPPSATKCGTAGGQAATGCRSRAWATRWSTRSWSRPGSRTRSTRSARTRTPTIPAVVERVTDPEVPKLIEAIYGIKAPATPRNDLVEIFLTGITTKANGPIKADLNSQLNNADVDAASSGPSEMLRLNTGRPAGRGPRTGSACSPATCRASRTAAGSPTTSSTSRCRRVEGAAQTGKLVDALAAGDKVDANDKPFGTTFPYVALPSNVVGQPTLTRQPGRLLSGPAGHPGSDQHSPADWSALFPRSAALSPSRYLSGALWHAPTSSGRRPGPGRRAGRSPS